MTNQDLKHAEYLQLSENKKQIAYLTDSELNSLDLKGLQVLLGSKLGDGRFYYSLKLKNNDKLKHGHIRTIITGNIGNNNKDESGGNDIAKILQIISGSQGTANDKAFLLLKEQNNDLKKDNVALKDELQDLRDKLYEEKEESGGGFASLIPMIMGSLGKKNSVTLSDNMQAANLGADVPPNVIDLLNQIDWTKVTQDELTGLVNKFGHFIPLKK